MRSILIFAFIALFTLGVAVSMADEAPAKDKTSCPPTCTMKKAEGTSTTTQATEKGDVADPHAGCPMMKGGTKATAAGSTDEATAVTADVKATTETKASEDTHCPDVKGMDRVEAFHEVMHNMHTALKDNKFDELRSYMPKLEIVAAELATYKCPMGDKCPPDCLKSFESRKATLLKDVDELKTSCQGTDNEKLKTSYMAMHTAYVEFASTCKPPAEAQSNTTSAPADEKK